jgi:flagellar motor switch protein FliG
VQKRDSHETMAEIFNNFDRANEAKYMAILEQRSPEHAEKVKKLMFTFDDLIKLKSSDVGILMRSIDKSKLTLALKGASEQIRKMFIDNMSQRASKILIEDMEALGPVRLKDVDEAQSMIIITLKEMIAREEIILPTGEDKDEFIL